MSKNVNIKISGDGSSANKAINSVDSSLSKLAKTSGSISTSMVAMGSAIGNVIGNVVSKAFHTLSNNVDYAVKRLDTLNRFPIVLQNLGVSAGDASKAVSTLADYTLGLPTTLNDAAQSVQYLTSATNNVKQSISIFEALNDAVVSGSQSTEVQTNALRQWSEAIVRGSFDVEREFTSLVIANAKAVNEISAHILGVGNDFNDLYTALRKGTVSVYDVCDAMIYLDKNGVNGLESWSNRARNAVAGIDVAITRLKTNIGKAMAVVAEEIGWKNIYTFINNVGDAIYKVGTYVAAFIRIIKEAVAWVKALFGGKGSTKELVKPTQEASSAMGGIASGAQDTASGLSNANKQAKALSKQLASFDEMNVLKEDTSSSGSGGSGGAGGGGGGFNAGDFEWDSELESSSDKVGKIVDKIKAKFSELSGVFGVMPKTLQALKDAFIDNFSNIWNHVSTVANNIKEIWDITIDAMGNTWATYGEEIDASLANLITSWSGAFMSLQDLVFAPFEGFTEGFKQRWAEVAQSVTDSLAIISISTMDTMASVYNTMTTTINTLTPFLQSGFQNLGKLFAQMLSDMSTSTAKWLPEIQKNFADFFENLNEGLFRPLLTIAGTIWEDFCEDLLSWWDTYGADILDGVGQMLNGLMEWFNKLWTEVLEPIIKPFLDEFLKVWENTLRPALQKVGDFVGKLIVFALDIWNNVIQPIINWLTSVLAPIVVAVGNTIGGVINSVLSTIGSVVNAIFTILGGIIDFISGVFSGNWEKAWNGIKDVFKGIVGGLGAIFKTPLNFIIDAINGFIRGLNRIEIPDWVPAVGGKGFHIAELPKLAKGGIVDRAMLAMVGESGREAVVPLENNTGWINELASAIAEAGGGGGQPIAVYVGGEKLLDTVIDGINERNFTSNGSVINI